VISCGYCIQAIKKAGRASDYWKECEGMDAEKGYSR
jgi:hypothetical protein